MPIIQISQSDKYQANPAKYQAIPARYQAIPAKFHAIPVKIAMGVSIFVSVLQLSNSAPLKVLSYSRGYLLNCSLKSDSET